MTWPSGAFDDCLVRAQQLIAYASPADRSAKGRGDNKKQHQQGPEPKSQDIGGTGGPHCPPLVLEQFAGHSLAKYRPNELTDEKHNRDRGEKGQVFILNRPGVNRQARRSPDP